MKFRKTVSAIAALATVCSAFAIAPVANAGDAESRTTYYMNAETFDNYNITKEGWTSTASLSIRSFTNVPLPADGEAINKNDDPPIYVSGNTLTITGNGNAVLPSPVSNGQIYFSSDMYTKSTGECYVSFKDSAGNEVAKMNMGKTSANSVYLNGIDKDYLTSGKKVNLQALKSQYGFHLDFTVDLDNDTATVTLDFIDCETYLRTTDTMSVSIDESAEISSIEICNAGDTGLVALDNTTLYSYETTEAWQFKDLSINDYNTGTLSVDFQAPGDDGTVAPSTKGFIISELLNVLGGAAIVSGEGGVNFSFIITEIDINTTIDNVYITPAENSEVEWASGTFEADAEIDESEFIEIGDSEFDVE